MSKKPPFYFKENSVVIAENMPHDLREMGLKRGTQLRVCYSEAKQTSWFYVVAPTGQYIFLQNGDGRTTGYAEYFVNRD